jgi:KDO2-lipid IV(A) lauroyltransferase
MKHHPVRYKVEAAAAAVVAGIVRALPRRRAIALGRAIGAAWGRLDPRHLGIAAGNLGRSFPGWTPERARAVALDVYRHVGGVLHDILWMTPRPREAILDLVEIEGIEHVDAALAAGRGVLVVTAHIGNWELHGVAHGFRFGAIGVVARALDNPALDERLCAFRRRPGNTVIYKKRALSQVITLLRANKGIAILIDQNIHDGGVYVDFFGRPAATTTVAAALALKTGCALVPAHSELQSDGRYRLVYEPALAIERTADREADLVRVTQQLTTVIEGWVRAQPGQWLWLHKRWKTQPAGAAP